MNARKTDRARAAGLRTRPLQETLADALAWEQSRTALEPRPAGLSDEEERLLLAAIA
jgi:hypothetical protein